MPGLLGGALPDTVFLIIPVDSNDVEKFKYLIKKLRNNIEYLFEIIVVFSNFQEDSGKSDFEDISLIANNKLILIFNEKICFP